MPPVFDQINPSNEYYSIRRSECRDPARLVHVRVQALMQRDIPTPIEQSDPTLGLFAISCSVEIELVIAIA